jgi:hypothetical protein
MMTWWKAHHGMVYDAKIGIIAKGLNARRTDVGMVWMACLEFSSSAEEREKPRGNVDGICPDTIAFGLDLDSSEVNRILDGFRDRKMIVDGVLTAWDKRQKMPTKSTARVRKHRNAAKHDETRSTGVSDGTKHDETLCNGVTETKTETETENKKLPTAPPLDFDNFPESATVITQKFPSADYRIVGRITQDSLQAFLSVKNPKVEFTDSLLSDALRLALKESPQQHSAALFLKTVPTITSNWAKNGRTLNGNAFHLPDPTRSVAAMKEDREKRRKELGYGE